MLSRLRIGPRLVAAFLFVAALCAFVGVRGVSALGGMQAGLSTIYLDRVVPLEQLSTIAQAWSLGIVRSAERRHVGQITWAEATDRIARARGTIKETWTAYLATYLTPEEKVLAAEAEATMARATEKLGTLDRAMAARDEGALQAFVDDGLDAAVDPVLASMAALSALQLRVAKEIFDEGTARFEESRALLIAAGVLAVLLAIGLGLVITRSITRPLRQVVQAMEQLRTGDVAALEQGARALARGDLSVGTEHPRIELPADAQDELGTLARSFNAIAADTREASAAFARTAASLKDVMATTQGLVEAAARGELTQRGEATRFEGGFRVLVGSLNELLDAVSGPLRKAVEALEKLAQRDLTVRVEGEWRGDYGRMIAALDAAAQQLRGSLGQVSTAAREVASASGQIASSSQLVARSASEQASALEETSAMLVEIGGATRENAEASQQAHTLVVGVQGSSRESTTAVGAMLEAMTKIRVSAGNTTAIIEDINEIAFQTNLLALNAAVEAARAGDAGRGFAVVAEEVRALALRSKEAASKTTDLLGQSVKLASDGEGIAKRTGEAIGQVGAAIDGVTTLVEAISRRCASQVQGLEQVTKAMTQIDQATQQSAASSEESSSAAEELAAQSEELAHLVGQFQLGSDGARANRRKGPALRLSA